MSPLTKLFVVLLVLVSIVLTTGVVTFVNKLDPMREDLDRATADLSAKDALLSKREADANALNAKLDAIQTAAANDVKDMNTKILALKTQLETSDTALASAKAQIAGLTSANSSSSAALQLSEDAKSKLQEQVTGLRKDNDDRLRQVTELNTRVSTLTSQNAVLEKERRNLVEQLTEANTKKDQMSSKLKDLGVRDDQLLAAGTKAGAPAINGVIRSRQNIAGKEYAKISIGSQDYVTKGMEFKILDKDTGMFLGILTVDVVDSNEAMGQIVADPNNLAQIRAGNVVRTQM